MEKSVRVHFYYRLVITICISIFSGMQIYGQTSDWVAPNSADDLKNPLSGNTAAIDAGKKLFKQMCSICHGNAGKGDGMAGMTLTPRPSDLTISKVQSQSDGAIYWKMTEGRPPMAAYKDILKEEQRWQLINYIRTLKR